MIVRGMVASYKAPTQQMFIFLELCTRSTPKQRHQI